MAHIKRALFTRHVNESWHILQMKKSLHYIWVSHGTHKKSPHHKTCASVMAHITYKLVITSHMNESWHTYVWKEPCSQDVLQTESCYGVATIRRLIKIIGLFCKRALQKRRCSVEETYDFKEPPNRSHPIYDAGNTYDISRQMQEFI